MPADSDAGLIASLRGLGRDGRLLFLTRLLRMFAYGSLAVVLVLYLASLGIDAITIGVILTLTLIGDTLISLWLTTHADRFGRRRVLIVGSLLMAAAGIAFALTSVVALLILAATIGVLSPSGNEVGPFLAIEQAALSETIPDERRTATFAWYNLAGYGATAVGSLAAGLATSVLLGAGWPDVDAYRAIVFAYAALSLAHGRRLRARRPGRRAATGRGRGCPRRMLAGSASGASRGRSLRGFRPCSRSTRSRAGSCRRP